MNRYRIAAMAALMAVSITACKIGKRPTRKQITVENKAGDTSTVAIAPTPPPAAPAISAEKQQLVDKLLLLWNDQIQFSTFSGKAKMHYDGRGQKYDFTANFRINKDRVIWVSINAFVIQVARAYITPDSIFVVNYMEREAYKMPIADANKLLPAPMDFAVLQNFIIGNALDAASKPTDATDFGGTWSLQMTHDNMIQQATYNKADSSMRSLQLLTADNKMQGMIQFGNYERIQGRRFPNSRVINMTNNGEQLYLDMNFNNVEFDKQLDFPFSIPKNYKIK